MTEHDVGAAKWIGITLICLFALATIIGSVRAHYNAQILVAQMECEARQ